MIILLLFLLVIPFFAGHPVRKILNFRGSNYMETYLCGNLLMWVVSGAVQLLLLVMKRPFSQYTVIFSVLMGGLGLAGMIVFIMETRQKERIFQTLKGQFRSWFQSRRSGILFGLVLGTFLLCTLRIWFGQPVLTGDFTMETVNTTLAADSIYQYHSLTGLLIEEGMPIRQQILTLPFFLAFLIQASGLDAGLVIYQIFPVYVLLLTFLTYGCYSGFLFPREWESQNGFLFIVGVLLLFGDYAQAAPASLLLHQGFTGNALAAGVIIPLAVYFCISKKWLLAFLCAAAEIFVIWTTYGAGFCALVLVFFALLSLWDWERTKIRKRKG